MGIFILLLVLWSAVWVYGDATKNQIGHGGDGAIKWAAATLLLWIIVFPYYLFKRKSLIASAKEHPTLYSNRKPVLIGLSVFAVILSLVFFVGAKQEGLPGCEDAEVTKTAKQTIADSIGKKLASANISLEIKALTNISEQGFDDSAGVRVCRGELLSSAGADVIVYTIKWQNKSKGIFLVETQIAQQ